MRCQENLSDLRSRGTRAQIEEHQTEEIRKGQKGKTRKWGGRGNKY